MAFGFALCGALLFSQRGAQLYGDYRYVSALAIAADEHVWVATRGGLIELSAKEPRSFGWSGLVQGRSPIDAWIRGGAVYTSSGELSAVWSEGACVAPASDLARATASVLFANGKFVIPDRPVWPDELEGPFAPPAGSRGTHVTAVAGTSERLYAAWYGDGLWQFASGTWTEVEPPAGASLASIRAVATKDQVVAVATGTGDVWLRDTKGWRHLASPEGPGGSVYSLASYRGKVFAGTFENGLTVFDGRHWYSAPVASHPREMVAFRGALYARQTTGEIDRFDGRRWSRNVFPWLLRGATTCLACSGGKLLIGQFGGWSEYDGSGWRHFLKLPELQGLVVTALAATKNETWVGTQERGLLRFADGKSKIYDQRSGLGDDWVRHIFGGAAAPRALAAGLFKTGAYELDNDTFESLTPEIRGEITGFARDPRGRLLIASREGLWRDRKRVANYEIQTILAVRDGVWLGLPMGALFLPWREIA